MVVLNQKMPMKVLQEIERIQSMLVIVMISVATKL